MEVQANHFAKLAAIDCSKYVEKKQNLTYLSWPFAVHQLMLADPSANWEFHEPKMFGETMMVSCTVTAFGKPMTMHLPVMDHRNNAIKNPDAFAVNKNMMRCLVKAIACHGLGLYIYAGEDLPGGSDKDDDKKDAGHKRDVSPERAKIVRRIADACIAAHAKGDDWGVYENACAVEDPEERLLLWDYLHDHSAVRSAIKRMAEAERAKEPSKEAA